MPLKYLPGDIVRDLLPQALKQHQNKYNLCPFKQSLASGMAFKWAVLVHSSLGSRRRSRFQMNKSCGVICWSFPILNLNTEARLFTLHPSPTGLGEAGTGCGKKPCQVSHFWSLNKVISYFYRCDWERHMMPLDWGNEHKIHYLLLKRVPWRLMDLCPQLS